MKKILQALKSHNIQKTGLTVFTLFLAFTLVLGLMLVNQPIVGTNATPIMVTSEAAAAVAETETVPKYIFLFIGDGMSYPQIQMASYYLGAMDTNGGVESRDLSFMAFPAAGSASTWDLTSFAPDSASTATSIATGEKTWSGTINMDSTLTIPFETIAEKLKTQLGYRIGIVTSVNLNHATPAAFYAQQASRNSTYAIGLQMIESGFEYFAGGALNGATGDGTQPHILELAAEAGYKVIETYEGAAALTPADGKAILIAENLDGGGAFNYALDAQEGEWSLADYTEKGIEMLYNGNDGFFMMVEGGKIDWAGHANDAAANIFDVLAFDEAVQVALEFYAKYPEDTLIIVTGDHETGGLAIGWAGLEYDTFLANLSHQQVTYEVFGGTYVPAYRENNTPFEDVLEDVLELFGMATEENADKAADETLVLTEYEVAQLKRAYDRAMAASGRITDFTEEEFLIYGTPMTDPLTVTITHLHNNKSGIGWTSYAHTGLPVPVFAIGNGADVFNGFYDNTDIYHKMARLTGIN